VIATPGYKEPAAYVNLGWVYRNMEPSKPTESVSAYKKALELDPKNEQAALGMGWAYSYMKQYDEGIAAFKKAIELDPKVAGEAYDGIAWSYFFKKDMAAAKDNLAKAKAAGRNDTRLEANIDKFEKGQQEAEEAEKAFRAQQRAVDEPDVNTLGNQVMHGGPSARRSAARQLRQFGRPAVQFLIYAATSDKDLDVREEAINSLGAIGAGARDQCGQVRAIATGQNPYEKVVQERAEMELAAKYEDVRRAAKAAMGSIGCN
jgi:tetratricopeptide (TPR) repeat protein